DITLSKGKHTMRFVPQGDMNFDNFIFYNTATSTETTVFSSLNIFPIPSVDGLFQLQGCEMKALVIVTDLFGRIVLRKMIISNNDAIDLTQCGRGVYILSLQTGNEILIRKLIYR